MRDDQTTSGRGDAAEPVADPVGPVPDDLPGASFLLMMLGRRIREHAESALREQGIALRHLSALGHLARDPGMSYSDLARRAGVTPQSMQATLRTLEQRGAVSRDGDGGRGRTAQLSVTEQGHHLLRSGRAIFASIDTALAAPLRGPLEAGLVTATLTALRTLAEPPESAPGPRG